MSQPTYTAEQLKAATLIVQDRLDKRKGPLTQAAILDAVYSQCALTAAEERVKELEEDLEDRDDLRQSLNEVVCKEIERAEKAEAQLTAIRDAPVPMPRTYLIPTYTYPMCTAPDVERIFSALTRKIAALEAEKQETAKLLLRTNAGLGHLGCEVEKLEAENSQLKAKGDAGGWIAVSEEIPGLDVRVIFWVPLGVGYQEIGSYRKYHEEPDFRASSGSSLQYATHWKPLPSPPQDEAKG